VYKHTYTPFTVSGEIPSLVLLIPSLKTYLRRRNSQ